MDRDASQVTVLLRAWHAGDEDAYRRVSSILYGELRQQAGQYMRRRATGDMVDATALVHETFLRITRASRIDWQDRQ